MSAANSPSPQNLILLAGLGIGAYYLLSRRAMAGSAPRTAAAAAPSKWNNIESGVNVLGKLWGSISGGAGGTSLFSNSYYGGQASPAVYAGAATAARRDSDPDLNGSPLDLFSGGADGIAANPPFGSAYDFAAQYMY